MHSSGAENLLRAIVFGLMILIMGGAAAAVGFVVLQVLRGFWVWLAEFGAVLVGLIGFAVTVIAALVALGVL